VYAQDKWTVGKLTASYGVRYDDFANSFPEVHVGPSLLAPTRNYDVAHQDNIAWRDLTPKVGLTYDLLGNGKTALKASANKYLQNGGGGFGTDHDDSGRRAGGQLNHHQHDQILERREPELRARL
jgi:hypothetical protein